MEERAIRLRRVTAGTLTLALVLTLLVIQVRTAPPAAAASISVSPTSGQAGTSARVEGGGFLLLLTVTLCWDGENCSNLGSVNPLLGAFSVGITIPSGAEPGQHTITACQSGTCAETSFEVLSAPNTTVPATTTTSAPTTSSTVPTTTTTTTTNPGPTITTPPGQTTTTPPGPTTSNPGPTTTNPRAPTTTSPGANTTNPTSPPATTDGSTGTTTTTVPGQAGFGSTSSTSPTDEVGSLTVTTSQLPEAAAAPYSLDVKALVAQLFAPDPEAPVDAETAAQALGAPAAPLTPVTEPVEEEEDDESSLALGDLSADSNGFQPRFGIWLVWLAVLLASAGLALTFDEIRRRRNR